MRRRQCKRCGGIVGIDIMPDEWNDYEKTCCICLMEIEEEAAAKYRDQGGAVGETLRRALGL